VIVFSDMATRMLHGGILRSRVYVQQGATDLSGAYVERMTAFVGGGAGSGGGSVGDHATLAHLDYASSGHTGFLPSTATTASVPDSTNKRYVTDAQVTSIGSIPSLSSSTPAAETNGATGAVGTGTTAARADHVHAMPSAPTLGGLGGEPALGNPGSDGYVLSSTAAGVRSWSAVGEAPIEMTNLTPPSSLTITAGYGAVVAQKYTLNNGVTLTIGNGAILVIT
jgi:hypothetical protein